MRENQEALKKKKSLLFLCIECLHETIGLYLHSTIDLREAVDFSGKVCLKINREHYSESAFAT